MTDPQGRPVKFVPWFGALAHAIFFRAGLARLLPHPHLRPQRAQLRKPARASPASRITGRATGAGKLTVGVLLPAPGTWRLFLQLKQQGKILTAPFTLNVAS